MPFRRRRQYACCAYERACEESVSACSRKNFCISVHRQTGQTAKRRARDGQENSRKGEGNQRGWTKLHRGHFLHKIIKGNVSIPLFSSCNWSLIKGLINMYLPTAMHGKICRIYTIWLLCVVWSVIEICSTLEYLICKNACLSNLGYFTYSTRLLALHKH